MTIAAGDVSPGTASRRPRWAQRLHVRFLAIVVAAFLAFIVPASWLLLGFVEQADNAALTSRVGNLAARAAGAIDRHDAFGAPDLARDLMAPLAADRAFLCSELRTRDTVIAALPPAQGCVDGQDGHYVDIPVDEAGHHALRIGFTDTELQEARRLELMLAGSAIGLAFLCVLAGIALSYRFLIWRPLNRLTETILASATAGERKAIAWRSSDEIGLVVDAYNRLIAQEARRERDLRDSYDRIRQSECALNALNRDLESRVRERTAELEAAKREADSANNSKTRFLWSMSHELRTPLNAIIGFSEIISAEVFGPLKPSRYRDYADDILFSGQHLLKVINDLLDIARIEVGRETLDEEPVAISGLLTEALRVVRPLAEERDLTLCSGTSDTTLVLRIDATKTKQILLNLLSNAIKHTPAGGTVCVDVDCGHSGWVALRVVDTGSGIAREDLSTVLEPFGRSEANAHLFPKGTGLGLPLARHMAEMHGGRLDLHSEVGSGTTVTVFLPASRIVVPAGRPEQAVPCPAS